MAEQFSNKQIIEKLLPRCGEIAKRMLDKHVRLAEQNHIMKMVATYLDEASQKALTDEMVGKFKDFIKEIYPVYLASLYNAFDSIVVTPEGEEGDLTRQRSDRCDELSLWIARYITENPSHSEDEAFLDLISREIASKFLHGMPRLDAEVVFKVLADSIQGHTDSAFRVKFGKSKEELALDDIDEILKEEIKQTTEANDGMKKIPKES